MKTTIAYLLTLAAASTATPTNMKRGCGTPGVYRCAPALDTMEVCDFDGNWKRLDPGCPADTECQPNPFGNNIPYCMVKGPGSSGPGGSPGGSVGGSCSTAGQYSCTSDYSAIQICDLSYVLELVGACPNYCANIAGIPYCF